MLHCQEQLICEALNLINHKDSKVAELTEENKRLQAEIERLKETQNRGLYIEEDWA